jgi:hypothetical protein
VVDARCTLRLADGIASLWTRPSPTPKPFLARQAEEIASSLDNEQCFWSASVRVDSFGNVVPKSSGFVNGLPFTDGLGFGIPELARPLLDALEDPRKIASAHLLLQKAYAMSAGQFDPPAPIRLEQHGLVNPQGYLPPHSITLISDGLRMELWPDGAEVRGSTLTSINGGSPTFCLDPASFASVRERWHQRLDVQVVSLPIWPLMVVAALPPIITGFRYMLSKLRRRRGSCPTCGYNLTGNTSGTCPECGTPITIPT